MASTYTDNNGIEKPGTGEKSGSWGGIVNTNFDILDRATNGVGDIAITGNTTVTTSDGSTSNGQFKVLNFTGSLTSGATITIDPNSLKRVYLVHNNSGDTLTFSQGSGSNVTVDDGKTKIIYCDGGGSTAAVTDFSTDLDMSSNTTSGVPAGTKQLFVQSTAPTGWTKDTTHDNKAIRVVTGTASSGGTVDFDVAFASQTPTGTVATSVTGTNQGTSLSAAQLPSHNHKMFKNTTVYNFGNANLSSNSVVSWQNNGASGTGDEKYSMSATSGTQNVGVTGSSGSGQSHTHTWSGTATSTFTGSAINLDVNYVDVIICTKS